MSFIGSNEGKTYTPGWFLVNDEQCTRLTKQIAQEGAVDTSNGGKYVPMGTIWPSNNNAAEGIVYEDVDVTTGDMPGSVVTKGKVYVDRLPAELNSAAKTALEEKGFIFTTAAPTVTRPY